MSTPPVNASVRTQNDRPRPLADAVLRLIWEERQISRAEIARRMQLSRSTVSEIVSSLLATGLVAEAGVGASRGGRRPIVLEFQDDAAVILGAEMGAAHVFVVLTNLRGELIAQEERLHPVRSDPTGTRRLIIELCERCLDTWKGDRSQLLGLGIAVPSPIDPKDVDSLSEVVLPEWNGRTGFEEIRTHFGVPLFVDNDANLGAVAEGWWGAGRGLRDFAYIKVATGIGSGHVIDGKVYRGSTGVAGEIGHVAIDPKGGPCVCGLRGCLATLVGHKALLARARELLAEYPESSLADHGEKPTLEFIEDAAVAGDELAVRVVHEAAGHLGTAIAGLLNIMNPSVVIVGGGLSRAGEVLLEPLREMVRRRTLVSSLAAAEVCVSELGNRSIAIGAATFVLQAALEDPALFPGVALLRNSA